LPDVTSHTYDVKLHVPHHVLFLNLKSILLDSLEETSPVPSQLGQIISPEPVHLAQSASPIVDNSGRLIGFFRSHARQSIVPTPSHL
jgi:hypothetical protein